MSQPAVLFAMGLSPTQREHNAKVGHNQDGLSMTCGVHRRLSNFKKGCCSSRPYRWRTRNSRIVGDYKRDNFDFVEDGDTMMIYRQNR